MKVRLAVLSLFAVTPVFAQPKPAAPDDMVAAFEKEVDALFVQGGLTADQAAARASKVSPSVKRNAAEVDEAIAIAQAAELTRVPQIGAKLAYARLSEIDPLVFAPPPAPPFAFPVNSYSAQAQVVIPLSDYGLRYPKLIDAAKAGTEAARTSKRSSEINAGQEARLAYYEWIRARLQVLVSQRQHVQVQGVVRQMRALADAQRVSKADLMRVESQEAQSEEVVSQLRNLEALREEQLRILIGASPSEPLGAGEDIRVDVTAPSAGQLDDMLARATGRRLEFRVLDTGIIAKEKQRESEKASRLPRLSAFATVDYANPNPRVFPQTPEFNLTWQAGLQLTWTLNDTLLAQTTLDRMRAEADQLRADRENLLRGTRIEILAAQQAVLLAQQSLVTSQKRLAASEEGYRVRRELLNAERATAVELVDAETELTRARIAALNARVDLRLALTQLAHALGEDVPTGR